MSEKLVVVGGGNMGGALLRGVLEAGLFRAGDVCVVDVRPDALVALRDGLGVSVSGDLAASATDADVVLLAVKPFALQGVLETLRKALPESALVLSILAGAETSTIEAGLGQSTAVVRAMPNLPATVGAGATAICGGRHATESHLERAESFFGAAGLCVRVLESQMDAVTGLSGSGPAFVFLAIEALADAGVRVGLPRDVSGRLAAHTVLGAARLVTESGEHPAVLKDRVTTPGGTTIAGLRVLEDRSVRGAFQAAVEAATERAREIGRDARR